MVEGDTFKTTVATNNIDMIQSSLSDHTDQDRLQSMTGFVGSQLAGDATMTEGIMVDPDANTRRLQLCWIRKWTVLESAINMESCWVDQ